MEALLEQVAQAVVEMLVRLEPIIREQTELLTQAVVVAEGHTKAPLAQAVQAAPAS